VKEEKAYVNLHWSVPLSLVFIMLTDFYHLLSFYLCHTVLSMHYCCIVAVRGWTENVTL